MRFSLVIVQIAVPGRRRVDLLNEQFQFRLLSNLNVASGGEMIGKRDPDKLRIKDDFKRI